MISKKLFFKLFPAFLIVSLLAMIPVVWFSSHIATDLYNKQIRKELSDSTAILRNDIAELIQNRSNEKVKYLDKIAEDTEIRLTVISMGGEVLFDSEKDHQNMENHADRPEIQKAFSGSGGYKVRYSNTLKIDMMYYASPVIISDKKIGVMRISLPVDTLQNTLREVYIKVAVFGIITAFICTILISLVTKKLVSPLEKLYRGAARYASGNFDKKLTIESTDEIGGVAEAVNKMGEQLQKNTRKIVRQAREEKAILKSMREGVIAVSSNMNLIKINKSALSLLNISAAPDEKMPVTEVIRNPIIIDFIEKVINTKEFDQKDIVLYDSEEKLISIKGTPLVNENQELRGAVIVLNDVTRIRRLETMRKDFVANVSHEIRTPIAAIQGATETLDEGAIENKDDALFFLKMIKKNCRRLSTLIEDILALSKLDAGKRTEEFQDTNILGLIDSAVSACQSMAKHKSINIAINCDEKLHWSVNPSLIHQAIVNLTSNSIKYSNDNTSVVVSAEVANHQLVLKVADEGFGIDTAEQERIFERFYRVDKSHSSKIEGTGLGLAIVKHIVASHNGKIDLESKLGKGSTFTLSFPVFSN